MEPEQIRRRHLPHWDVPDGTYFVTVCLEDSIPAQGLRDLARYEEQLRRRDKPPTQTEDAWKRHTWKLRFVRQEHWLDHQPGNRALEQPELAQAVVRSMFYFAGQRYDLLAYVVMPSHFHWVFQPLPAWVERLPPGKVKRSPRERIVQSINRESSRRCNKLRGGRGAFWQHECYDHWIRAVDVEDARISTVYDGDGRQRTAGLELWLPGEDFPRRAFGRLAAGASLALEGLDVHEAVMDWRMDTHTGAGFYELTVREPAPAAA